MKNAEICFYSPLLALNMLHASCSPLHFGCVTLKWCYFLNLQCPNICFHTLREWVKPHHHWIFVFAVLMSLSFIRFIRYIDLNDTHFIAVRLCVCACVCVHTWKLNTTPCLEHWCLFSILNIWNVQRISDRGVAGPSYCTCFSCCSDQSHAWHFDVFVEEDTQVREVKAWQESVIMKCARIRL